jgi:zinc transport system permease protein
MLVLDVIILVLAILFYKELLAISFDETFATIANVPVDSIYLTLMCMIALTIVMMMRVVGLIMVIALLTMPAAISGLFVKNLRRMMIVASLLGMAFTTIGLGLSYALNLTSGATIILVAGVAYLVSIAIQPLLHRSPRSSRQVQPSSSSLTVAPDPVPSGQTVAPKPRSQSNHRIQQAISTYLHRRKSPPPD